MMGFNQLKLNDDDDDNTNTEIEINDNNDAKHFFLFFHNDYNANGEISKPKTSMMVTITRHILKIGQ